MKVFHVNAKINRNQVLRAFPKAQSCASCLSVMECATISVNDGKVAISFVFPGMVSIIRAGSTQDANAVAKALGIKITEVVEEGLDQAFESQMSVAVGKLLRCFNSNYI